MTTPDAPRHSYNDDEISLVDLAIILVRRWKAMAVVFIAVMVCAVAAAFLLPKSYQYATLYNIAEYTNSDGELEGVESPEAVVAKAENIYLGAETRALLKAEKLDNLPFEVSVENPKNTLLVQFNSEAAKDERSLVSELHQRVAGRIKDAQAAIVNQRRNILKQQLETAREALASSKESTSPNAGELVATYLERVTNLEQELAGLHDGEVTQLAVQGLKPAGVSKTLVLAVGFFLGVLLAIMAAFMMQFCSLVRAGVKNT